MLPVKHSCKVIIEIVKQKGVGDGVTSETRASPFVYSLKFSDLFRSPFSIWPFTLQVDTKSEEPARDIAKNDNYNRCH